MKEQLRGLRRKWHNDLRQEEEAHYRQNNDLLQSVFSYCQNEMVRSRPGFAESAAYRYARRVHELLELRSVKEPARAFCRVGRPFDGGYAMVEGFSDGKTAYSFGIAGDTSWDWQMAEQGYQVYQYDHTIRELPQRRQEFHWQKLGVTGGKETAQLKQLKTLLSANGHADTTGMVLKMDVEGAEWEVLENAPDGLLEQFDQIVLELHDLAWPREPDRVLRALERLTQNHQAVYLHPNNNAPVSYCGELIMPNLLEATFLLRSKFTFGQSSLWLPTELDQPCKPDRPEVILGRWNLPPKA